MWEAGLPGLLKCFCEFVRLIEDNQIHFSLLIKLNLSRDTKSVTNQAHHTKAGNRRGMLGELITSPDRNVIRQLRQQEQQVLRLFNPRPCLLFLMEVSTAPLRKL